MFKIPTGWTTFITLFSVKISDCVCIKIHFRKTYHFHCSLFQREKWKVGWEKRDTNSVFIYHFCWIKYFNFVIWNWKIISKSYFLRISACTHSLAEIWFSLLNLSICPCNMKMVQECSRKKNILTLKKPGILIFLRPKCFWICKYLLICLKMVTCVQRALHLPANFMVYWKLRP